MDESLLLGEWGSERKRVEVQGFLSASLILSLWVALAGFLSLHFEGSVLEFHDQTCAGG